MSGRNGVAPSVRQRAAGTMTQATAPVSSAYRPVPNRWSPMTEQQARSERSPRATVKDVARVAGVSRSTVSRALTGNGYVSAEIRREIIEAAESLNYVPDKTARSLRQQSSSTIGVIVSDLRNPFYADMASGVATKARESGLTMLLVDDDGDPAAELAAVTQMIEQRVCGVIIAPISAPAVERLLQNEIPVVEVDRQFAAGRCDAVVVDNRTASHDLVAHLVALGHTRIAVLVDQTEWTTGRDRLGGYRDALTDAGIDRDAELVVQVGWSVGEVRAEVGRLLTSADAPTALFAVNNVVAEGAYRAVADAGLRLPHDISMVSFDDAPWMSMVSPGMTAAGVEVPALGSIAAGHLLGRIANPGAPIQTATLFAPVLERGSTGPVPATA